MEMSARLKVSRILGTIIVFTICTLLVLAFVPAERRPLAANESAAAGSLRVLNSANFAYANDHPQLGYAKTPSDLARRPHNAGQQNPEWMIDPLLAAGEKSGYRFTYRPGKTTEDGKLNTYQVFADPLVPGKTGRHHFFTDETGIIRLSDSNPASAASVALE